MAYRLLQAIFKKITDDGCTDDGYNNSVSFSERAMGRDLGLSGWGGKSSKMFKEAVDQLHRTNVSIKVHNSNEAKSKSRKQWYKQDFYIIPKVRSAGTGDRIEACRIFVDEAIIESLNKKYWVKFDYNHLKSLEPSGMVMYKRLYRYFMASYSRQLTKLKKEGRLSAHTITEARKSVIFSKMYVDIIAVWFGGDLSIRPYPKGVREQLGKHLSQIRNTGLIRSWKVEKAKDGELKIVFKPGMGFFRAYEQLWLNHNHQPSLPFSQSSGLVDVSQPLQVIEYFYEKWLGITEAENKTYPTKQFEYAKQLVAKYGYSAVQDFVDFSIKKARADKFDMATFNAIQTYESRWCSEKRSIALRKERQNEQAAAEHLKAREQRYDDYVRSQRSDYRNSLSEAEFDDLKQQAKALCLVDHPNATGVVLKAGLMAAEVALISEAVDVLSYEQWIDFDRF